MHALIVDDSKTARYALRQLLDKQKVSVDMVESAEDALDYLESRRGDAPDLIFMDHMMPGMDGFEAVKELKANPSTADIPIVMYTSTQGGMYFGQARALGAVDVISKPATADDLREVLRRLREQHRDAAAPAAPSSASAPAREPVIVAPAVDAAAEEAELFVESEDPARVSRAGYWLAALLALPLAYFGWQYFDLTQQLERQRTASARALEWAFSQSAEFRFGDIPFSDARARQLQDLVANLRATGFRGRVVLEGHAGVFCLQRDASGVRLPSAADIPLTGCSELGQAGDPVQISGAQSAEFRRVLDELNAQDGGIQIELLPRGTEAPLYGYSRDLNAAQWNRVAQRNQRVQIRLEAER